MGRIGIFHSFSIILCPAKNLEYPLKGPSALGLSLFDDLRATVELVAFPP